MRYIRPNGYRVEVLSLEGWVVIQSSLTFSAANITVDSVKGHGYHWRIMRTVDTDTTPRVEEVLPGEVV